MTVIEQLAQQQAELYRAGMEQGDADAKKKLAAIMAAYDNCGVEAMLPTALLCALEAAKR